ncbi:MAG: DUF5615 family PIN-like protein [Candidatus Cybelea sp.]
MAWLELVVVASRYDERVMKEVEGTARFLLDNNVDSRSLLRFLDGQGISAHGLPPGLAAASDDEVLAEAWRQDRMLISHDVDFLDMRRHPPAENPGVVIIPGGNGTVRNHLTVIGRTLTFIKPYRGLWLQTYVHIRDSGLILIKGENATTGETIDPWYMTFSDSGEPLIWVEE